MIHSYLGALTNWHTNTDEEFATQSTLFYSKEGISQFGFRNIFPIGPYYGTRVTTQSRPLMLDYLRSSGRFKEHSDFDEENGSEEEGVWRQHEVLTWILEYFESFGYVFHFNFMAISFKSSKMTHIFARIANLWRGKRGQFIHLLLPQASAEKLRRNSEAHIATLLLRYEMLWRRGCWKMIDCYLIFRFWL